MFFNPMNIRYKLFLWYITSLVIITLYFFLAIHIFTIRYSTELFLLLIAILGIYGFALIYKLTNPIKILTQKISTITSKNLNERIKDIKSEDEIGKFANAFNELLNRLETAFKREQQFIADVAHELKTPIATIKVNLEVTLSKERTIADYKDALEESLIDIDRVTTTLNDVLDLSWIQTENYKKQYKEFNISHLVADIVEIANKLAIKKKINVSNKVEPNILIIGDKEKISRAILNLVDNAIKYSKSSGKIKIKLSREANVAIIEIKDSGIGIPASEIKHIFEKFYRGTKSTKIAGSGIGLALTKSVIVAHGGTIDVSSDVDKGTTFIVKLPLN